jgi:hypothetical protein
MVQVYRAGFVGGAVEDALEWMSEKAQGATNICVPFAGIGRATIAMARPDTVIESWDTMHYPGCIYRGVFSASEIDSAVDKIRYTKGWAFENRGYKHLDDRCAGFMDWVAINGTDFDKACLGSAMIRSTLMGRLMHWHSNVEQLFGRFEKQREYNADWLNQPGRLIHHEANFFDALPLDKDYDLIEVDPPKVVNYSDVYSLHFKVHQQVLTQGQGTSLPKWNRRSPVPNMRKLFAGVKAPRVIFMYTSKVYPDYADMKKLLQQFAEIEEEVEFFHNGRYDYGLLLRR